MNDQSFVILRDLRGKPKALLRYERVEPQRHAVPPKSHHVVVVDRSGSMYGDMEQMRQLLSKLLAVEEFHRTDLHVFLLRLLLNHTQDFAVVDNRVGLVELKLEI